MAILRGYNAVRMYGDGTVSTTSTPGYTVGQGITDSTNLFTNIFGQIMTNKNAEAARKAELDARRLDNEIAMAQQKMMESSNAAQQAQLESLIAQLKIEQANAQQQAMQQQALAQGSAKTLSPLGWGLIAAGVGTTVFLVTRKK